VAVTGSGRPLQAAVTRSGRPLQAAVTGAMPWGRMSQHFLCLPPPSVLFCSWVALSPENVMSHIAPVAAGCQMSSHFTKYPTQSPGGGIWGSFESSLSKMISNNPPPYTPKLHVLPSPHHFRQRAPPLLLQKSNMFAISSSTPPKTPVVAF
jgi:hypothetical protein